MAQPSSQDLVWAALAVLDNECGRDGLALRDLCQAMLPKIGRKRLSDRLLNSVDQVLEGMVVSGLVLDRGIADGFGTYVLPKHLFEGACGRVSLTDFEQENRVLIPGHRYVPFAHPDSFPPDVPLLFDGAPLPLRDVELPAADALIYVSLLGLLGATSYLARENGRHGVETQSEDDDRIVLTAHDLAPVVAKHGETSAMVLRCLRYENARFEVASVIGDKPVIDFQRTTAGVRALDRAFDTVLAKIDAADTNIRDQIAHAYAQMDEGFLLDPPFHFGGYLQLSHTIGFADCGSDTRLWRQGEPPPPIDLTPMDRLRSTMAGLLDDMGADLDDVERSLFGALFEGMEALPPALREAVEDTTSRVSPAAPPRAAGGGTRVFTLEVALDARKRTYRIMEVHEDCTWEDLHEAIFDAFDRFDEHLYSFFLTGKRTQSFQTRWQASSIECPFALEGGQGLDAAATRLGEVDLRPGTTLYYLFDYGDEWWHEITVQSVESRPDAEAADYPVTVKKAGASPPQYPDL